MKSFSSINWDKIERFIGSLKFAVIVILLFTLAMVIGTFLESYYGTEFANRVIYKTFPFFLIQFGMLFSIIYAATLRLPPKKRLYGFYVIHAGLVTIGIGSLITYVAGVDGQITLGPNETSRQVILSKDIFRMTFPDEGRQVNSYLPYSAFPKSIEQTYENITVKEYIPYATGKFVWADPINSYPEDTQLHTSRYHFKNAFAQQELTLSVHPEATSDFPSSTSLGPLSFNYYPEKLADCFEQNTPSRIIIWNINNADCYTPEEKSIPIKATSSKNNFLVVEHKGKLLTFFPEISPYPMDLSFQSDEKSELRAFSKKLFENNPNLFLFGKKVSFFSKEKQEWITESIEIKGKPITLPWMNAELSLLAHETKLVPYNLPTSTLPIQKNGNIIKGDIRAVKLEIQGKEYWVTNHSPLSLIIQNRRVIFEVTKESLTLPFELSLSEFKMDKDPGTNNPASYESFIKLFDDGKMSSHHVYMNNPFKHSGYTFYQASYSQDSEGRYSSTLAVNVDQGRSLKYLGSLMLVLGSVWHFNLNKRKKKNNGETQ